MYPHPQRVVTFRHQLVTECHKGSGLATRRTGGEGGCVATFTSFDGTKLFYLEEGEGPPAVLLHGLTSSTEGNWRRPGIWNALLDAGKRIVGLDARGHGRSDKPHDPRAYERESMVHDVAS